MFWYYGENCLIALLIIFIFSQIILPPFIGKRFFWLFKKEENKIDEVKDELFEEQLKEVEERIKERVEEIRKQRELEKNKNTIKKGEEVK